MKQTIRKYTVNPLAAGLLLLFPSLLLTACDGTGDDLRDLGQRVEVLEDRTLSFTSDIEALQRLVEIIRANGYITQLVSNADGSTTISFSDKRQPITLRNGIAGRDGEDGQDGRAGDVLIGVAQADDGRYYWTFNGSWLLDAGGNMIEVGATDGRDGQDGRDGRDGQDGQDGRDGQNGLDGQDGHDGRDGQDAVYTPGSIIMPQVRVSADLTWEVSYDEGRTWSDTGVTAVGRDGQDGQDGQDGRDGQDGLDGQDGQDGRDGQDGATDSVFQSIYESGDYVVFVLADGRTLVVKKA